MLIGKKNHAISQNNMLVKQYIRAIQELQPKAFVMENVSMLRSDVHRFYLDETDAQLVGNYDIPMKETRLMLLEQEYMFQDAIDIVKNISKIEAALWPEEEYSVLNVIYKNSKNLSKMESTLEKHKKKIKLYALERIYEKNDDYIAEKSRKAYRTLLGYYEGTVLSSDIKSAIEPAIMIQRMLSKSKEIFDNHLVVDKYLCENGLSAVIRSYAVFDYLKAILGAEPNNYAISADVLCAADYGAPQKRMRFVVMGIKKSLSTIVELPKGRFKEGNYRTVRDAIEDLENIVPVTELSEDTGIKVPKIDKISQLGHTLRDTDRLFNHIVTKTRKTAMERFKVLKQGQKFSLS